MIIANHSNLYFLYKKPYHLFMKKINFFLPLILLALFVPALVSADEINYASIKDIKENTLLIEYKGPSGASYFTCNAETLSCEEYDDEEPVIFPEINSMTDYTNSPDGRLGVIKKQNETGTFGYEIYDLEDEPQLLSAIPYDKVAESIIIAPLNTQVFLFGPGGEVARFNIAGEKLGTYSLSMTEFPFRTISPSGTFLSAYSYSEEEHVIWNFNTGEEIRIPGQKASFVEFSMDDRYAAFTDDKEGFEVLYMLDLLKRPHEAERIFGEDFTVIDYLFHGDSLYYVSNESGAYDWSLFRYDPATGEKDLVAEDVSYNDYIRRVSSRLAFLTHEGKNTNVSLYDPTTGEVETIEPLKPSPTPDGIRRSLMRFGDNQGVLLRPEQGRKETGDLFIWLHGGPQRQASPAYHSYLSYAVYDELLDRLALGGAMVLKLDYPGSWGYGKKFIDSLNENIGQIDVDAIVEATKEIHKKRHAQNTYLIGNSYGGYLALRTLAEEPDLYKGAIGINGVYDWFTLISRIPSSPFRNLFNGTPDLISPANNSNLYRQASIITKLNNLEDKNVLLVLGEKDSTVPTWQTKEFYYLAEALGVNTELLIFPEEDHILRDRETLDTLCEEVSDFADMRKVPCKN